MPSFLTTAFLLILKTQQSFHQYDPRDIFRRRDGEPITKPVWIDGHGYCATSCEIKEQFLALTVLSHRTRLSLGLGAADLLSCDPPSSARWLQGPSPLCHCVPSITLPRAGACTAEGVLARARLGSRTYLVCSVPADFTYASQDHRTAFGKEQQPFV